MDEQKNTQTETTALNERMRAQRKEAMERIGSLEEQLQFNQDAVAKSEQDSQYQKETSDRMQRELDKLRDEKKTNHPLKTEHP